jgi:hypothetical protein
LDILELHAYLLVWAYGVVVIVVVVCLCLRICVCVMDVCGCGYVGHGSECVGAVCESTRMWVGHE